MPLIKITRGDNPFQREVQGKANEPITVAGLLDRARMRFGYKDLEYSLEVIYDRLEYNAPRIAIIGGSPDHPAHVMDHETILRAAYRIWQDGGVPFSFSIPVLCDGTAQSTLGMCYSLQSRLAVAEIVVNQMEAQSYHGAFVIQGCDKTPLAIVDGLALLDVVRQERGDAPVFATFAPAHVLKGGAIPEDLRTELEEVARRAEAQGKTAIADDLRDTMSYILQCSSNTAFQGVFERAVREGIITAEQQKDYEKRLAVNTCDSKGGICAFNGTGNSSRHIVSALGLVHPAVELLTEPANQDQVNAAVDCLFKYCNDPDYSVSSMVKKNIENAIRIYSATGGSTNIAMHLVSAMIYAGVDFSLWDYDRIRREVTVPDLFDYSLTQRRSIFDLAMQCCSGQIRGMETMFYELLRNGVPMNLDAPTATGGTWRERLSDKRNLSADGVKDNPIILSRPRRPMSGVDVLEGNFFESAVVKISGMSTEQIDEFDGKVFFVLYYENEDDANRDLLNPDLIASLKDEGAISFADLLAMCRHNRTDGDEPQSVVRDWGYARLFDYMVKMRCLKIAVVISGQGPEAFGMPEMFTPMQHINSNRQLRRLAALISDGRYSGVTYGAAIGHVTPEAKNRGGILYLKTGDVLLIKLRERRIDLLDREAFRADGKFVSYQGKLEQDRYELGLERLRRIEMRARVIAPTNRMVSVTDAAHGVVPRIVAEYATQPYRANRVVVDAAD